MNYYVVFQNKSFKEEHEKGILWAPTKDVNGNNPKFHWESMSFLKQGDVVFSIVKNKIISRGIILDKAIISEKPLENDEWGNEGWLAPIEYYYTENNIKVMDHIGEIRHMLPQKHSPFQPKNGRGNVGYLFPIGKELGNYFDNLISDVFITDDPSSVFDIDETDADIISAVLEEENVDEAEVILLEVDRPNGSNKPKTKRKKVFGKKTDFVKKTEENQKTGIKAELLVVKHEEKYLKDHGREDLAKQVKWLAKEADGYGYDVLSYNVDGTEKYIEVKATKLGKTAPFDISRNEVITSTIKKKNYWIYRVFYIDDETPKFYKLKGSIEENFDLEPTSYKAYFKEN